MYSDKDSKNPAYRELYETLPFIEAYSKHTDMRIEKDGPRLAIGAKSDGFQDWDLHGEQQMQFLIYSGIKPKSTLLDLGCGTGRLMCKAVPYLLQGNYTGMDISASVLAHCIDLLAAPFISEKKPRLIQGDGSLKPVKDYSFDYIWAHSVVTHLPPDIVKELFNDLSSMLFGEFSFTFKLSTEGINRTGLKQWAYPIKWFVDSAAEYGLKAEYIGVEWPAGQKTMRVVRG